MKNNLLIERLSLLPPNWEVLVDTNDPEGWPGTIDEINVLESESKIELTLRFR